MRHKVSFSALLLLCLISWHTAAQAGATLQNYAPDPPGYGRGFARSHYWPAGKKMLVFWGNSHNGAGGDNSIRTFDAASNTWDFLWANEAQFGRAPAGGYIGPPNRDNYWSLFIPNLGSQGLLLSWGGSGFENAPAGSDWMAGAFDPARKVWVTKSLNMDALEPYIQGISAVPNNDDPGNVWCPAQNKGIFFGGSNSFDAQYDQWIIEPNPASTPPYRVIPFSGSRPSPRTQLMNNLACDDKYAYLIMGQDFYGNALFDFWRFDLRTYTWEQLPDYPGTRQPRWATFPALSWDARNNLIVVNLDGETWTYSPATRNWSKVDIQTPALFNHTVVYDEVNNVHIYQRGSSYPSPDAGTPNIVFGIQFNEGTPTPTTAPPSTPPTSAPTPPPSTLNASYLGVTGEDKVGQMNQTTPNGKPDFHISVTGLRSTPNKVTITSDTGGIWETPFNGANWVMTTQYGGSGTGDLWFDQFASNRFHVKVRYADGTTDEADATNQASSPPPSLAPSPVVAPTAPPTSTPTPVTGLVPGQWIALPVPILGGSKHMTGAYDPDNQRLYFTGGDHGGGSLSPPDFGSSYRQETYSLSLKERFADLNNPNAGFRLEYPYCGPTNQLQPKHPDYIGWDWDAKRHVFWLVPGEFVTTGGCPGEDGTYNDTPPNYYGGGHLFTFNPATQTWSLEAGFRLGPGANWGVVYDPIRDQLIQFSGSGVAQIYNPTMQTWRTVGLGADVRIDQSALKSVDWEKRLIYAVDGYHNKLYIFNLDTEQTTDIADVPVPPDVVQFFDQPATVWDPVNRVLLYYRLPYTAGTFLAYHPDTKNWESLSITVSNNPNLAVAARTMVYDPSIQAVVAFGTGDVWTVPAETSNNLFVFQYGKGSGTPPSSPPAVALPTTPVTQPPTTPSVPVVPSTLQAKYVGVTGEDRVGRINQTSANGVPDFHVSVSGLRGTPNKVTITSDTGGIWETPFNGANWIIATQYDGKGNSDYWYEQFTSNKFHVKVRYADGTTDEADAVNPPPPPAACSQVITYAQNPTTGEVKMFTNPCVVPAGWQVVSQPPAVVPPPPSAIVSPRPTPDAPPPTVISPPVQQSQPTASAPVVSLATPPVPPATMSVIPNQLPTAKVTASPSTGVVGTSVTFDASGSSDRDGTIASYVWDFGDKTPTSQGSKVVHGYAKAGTYTATLTVTDNQGAKASTSVQIGISPPPAQPPCSQRSIRGLLTPCSPTAPPRRAG